MSRLFLSSSRLIPLLATVLLSASGCGVKFNASLDELEAMGVVVGIPPVPTAPSLTLTSLSGGQVIDGNSTFNITWSASDTDFGATPIMIEVSSNSGGAWTTLVPAMANTGTYTWSTPAVDSTTYRIRVTATDTTALFTTAASASNFTVAEHRTTVAVTAPNTLVYHRYSGPDVNITWTAGNMPAGGSTVDLDYSTDSGSTWTSIAAAQANSGTYSWSKPNISNTQVRVRVTVNDFLGIQTSDMSDVDFVIDNQLPSGSLAGITGPLRGGQTYSITWSGAADNILLETNPIELYYYDGAAWSTIALAEANDGTYSWTVPSSNTVGAVVRMNVFDKAGHVHQDTTAPFTIDSTIPSVVLTSSDSTPIIGSVTITATFSETVTGVTAADFSLTNLSAGAFTAVSGTVYTLVVNTVSTGAVSIAMAAGAGADAAGNNSTAATTLNMTYDPSCTVAFTTTGSVFYGAIYHPLGSTIQWDLGGTIIGTDVASHNYGSSATRSNSVTIADGSKLNYVQLTNWYYSASNNINAVSFSKGCYWMKGFHIEHNQLTSINIANLKSIETLDVSMNSLTSINVTANPTLKILDVGYNNLSALDVTQNTALEELLLGMAGSQAVNNNTVSSLDLSNNTALKNLVLTACDSLTSLDLHHNTALEHIAGPGRWAMWGGNLSSINLTGLTALKTLVLHGNQLTALDVSTNTALESLYVSKNNITSLDLTNNPALKNFESFYNQLTSLNISNNDNLVHFWPCWNNWGTDTNNIATLDFSQKTALTSVAATCQGLTSVDLSDSPLLTEVNVSQNQLTSLNLSNSPLITHLSIYDNNLDDGDWPSIALSTKPGLIYFYLQANDFATLNLSNNTALIGVTAQNNVLTSLNTTGLTALTSIYLQYNNLTTLDFSTNTALVTAHAYNNNLTGTVSFTTNTALTHVDISSNFSLTGVNLNGATSMIYFSGTQTGITGIDVSTNTAMTILDMRGTPLASLTLSAGNTALSLFDFNYLNPGHNMSALINAVYARRATLPVGTTFRITGIGAPSAPDAALATTLRNAPYNWTFQHD